jgi:hypothetical protein
MPTYQEFYLESKSEEVPSVLDPELKILLTRMDTAFSEYSRESEQLSVLLSKRKHLPSWTSYNDLLKRIVPPSAVISLSQA